MSSGTMLVVDKYKKELWNLIERGALVYFNNHDFYKDSNRNRVRKRRINEDSIERFRMDVELFPIRFSIDMDIARCQDVIQENRENKKKAITDRVKDLTLGR